MNATRTTTERDAAEATTMYLRMASGLVPITSDVKLVTANRAGSRLAHSQFELAGRTRVQQ